MKYRVVKGCSLRVKPTVATIENGVYVRDSREKRLNEGAVVTTAKLKGFDVDWLVEKGALVVVDEEEASDAR